MSLRRRRVTNQSSPLTIGDLEFSQERDLAQFRAAANTLRRKVAVANQPGRHVEVKVGEKPRLIAFERNRAHHGVVGTHAARGEKEAYAPAARIFFQSRTQRGI